MPKGAFDGAAFYAALDAERQSRKLTWKQVAREAGISASTLTRMAQGKRPDVDSLAALVNWSGLRADDFVSRTEGAPEGPDICTAISALLRADAQLSPRAAQAIEQVIRATYNAFKDTPNNGEDTAPEGIQN